MTGKGKKKSKSGVSKPQPSQSGTSESKSPPEKLKSDNVRSWTDMANPMGSGASSTVYKGFHQGKDVAVKVYKDNDIFNRNLWEAEKNALTELRHSHIVELIGIVDDNDQLMIVVEYYPTPLSKKLTQLTWKNMIQIFIDAARTLSYIHQQSYVFVDLKTDNLMLNKDGKLKIIDFGGIVQKGKESRVMTKGYSAPELFSEGKAVEETDIYSLGIVMLQLLMRSKSIGDCNRKKKSKGRGRGKNKIDTKDEDVPILDRAEIVFDTTQCVARKMDELLGCNFKQASEISKLALSCTERCPQKRPSTQKIIENLQEIRQLRG